MSDGLVSAIWFDALKAELAQARQQIDSLRRGFVNIYHFIEGKDCEPLVGIGMATSAVDRLKKRAESAEQQLAEARAEVTRLKRLMLKAQGIVGHIADDPGLGREERMRVTAVALELVAASKDSKREAAQALEPK